jgi:hypothetical protein
LADLLADLVGAPFAAYWPIYQINNILKNRHLFTMAPMFGRCLGRSKNEAGRSVSHTLPANRTAAEIWGAPEEEDEALTAKPAYEKLLEEGHLDQCGVTLLAGKAVGAPFVGATAATLVIAEILRLLHGGQLSQLIDLDLRSPDTRLLVPGTKPPTVNPGYTMAEPS